MAYGNTAFAATVITDIWVGTPLVSLYLVAAMQSISPDLYEAAWTDGAGRFYRFRRITLPLIAPAIATMALLSTIWTFNSFHMVFILTGGGPAYRTHILPTLAYEYGIGRSRLGLGAAVMVAVIPVFMVIIGLLTRRMLREKDA